MGFVIHLDDEYWEKFERNGEKDDLVEYRPNSHGAEDYLALCKEIAEREMK